MDPENKTGGAHADLTLDARKFTRGIDEGVRGIHKLENASKGTGGQVADSFNKVGTAALIGGAAIALGLKHAVGSFVSYEKAMNAVAAVTGAVGAEFDALDKKALQIGRDTVFSATEAAAAMEELAKAGISTKDILLGAADGAVALAAAAGESIPQAASEMAQTMQVFGLAGDQAMHVADLFAAAASSTNASAAGIAEGISNASAVFTLLKVPVETAVGIMAMFNDGTIMGAEAGTALKSSMLALLTPTRQQADLMEELGIDLFDANGEFIGMEALAGQLQKSLGGLTQEQRTLDMAILGGSYGIRGLNILYEQGAEGVAEYTAKVNVEGAAAEQAAIRNRGLTGTIENLKGVAETANIALGRGLAPALESVAGFLATALDGFNALSPGMQKIIGYVAVGTAGLLLITGAGIKTVMMFNGMATSIRTLITWLTASTAAENANAAASGRMAAGQNAAAASSSRLALAARGLAAALGLVATAAGVLIVVDSAMKAFDGPEGESSIAGSLGTKVEKGAGWLLGGPIGDWLTNDAEETEKDQELFHKLGRLGFHLKSSFVDGLQSSTAGTTIEELGGISVQDVQKYAEEFGVSFEDAAIAIAKSQGVTTDAIDAINAATESEIETAKEAARATEEKAEAARRAADPIYAEQQAIIEGIGAAKDKAAADELAIQVQDALNQEFIEGTGLLLPYTRGAKDVAAATREFTVDLHNQVAAVALASAGIVDMSSELPGLQQGYAKASDSIFRWLLNANKAGDIKLSSGDVDAFALADTLARDQAAIEGVNSAIANNQQDLGMWQGYIDLTNSVLGTNRDTLAEWEQALANGTVTQEEFNAAVADGRAVRAFDNLKQLLDDNKISQEEYDEILKAGWWLHERAVGGVEDEQAEIAKLLPDLAEYVRKHDEDARALKDLTPEQRARIAALQDENAAMIIQTALLVKLLEATGQISEEEGTQLLMDLTQFDPALQQALEDYGFFKTDVESNPPVVTPVVMPPNFGPGGSGATANSLSGQGNAAIVTPAADTTATETSLDTLKKSAREKGNAAGVEAGTGVTEGMATTAPQAETAASQMALDMANAFAAYDSSWYNAGFNLGWYWDLGVLQGLQSMAAQVWAQAESIAGGIENISRGRLSLHSPSDRGEDLGIGWNQGVAIGLRDTREIEDAARAGAERVHWAAQRGFGLEAGDMANASGGRGGGGSAPVIIQQGHTFGDLIIAPVFEGVTNTSDIINEIRVAEADAIDRLIASIP